MSNFLILPHQLFESKFLNKKNKDKLWKFRYNFPTLKKL